MMAFGELLTLALRKDPAGKGVVFSGSFDLAFTTKQRER